MDPRERERQIVIEARNRGLSDDFIKQAVLRDRERRAVTAPTDVQPVAPTATPAAPQKKGNLLSGIAGFLGVKNLGKGAAQAIATPGAAKISESNASMNQDTVKRLLARIKTEKNPEKKAKLKNILNKFAKDIEAAPSVEETVTDGEGFVSGRQVAGDAVSLATTLGTLGLGTAASTTGKMVAPAATTVGKRVAMGAAAGAGYGAAEATENAESIGEAVKDVATGAVTGAATSGAVEGVTAGVKKIALKRAGRLYDNVLGISKREAKNVIKSGGKTTGQKLVEKGGMAGFGKTKQGILDASQRGIDETEAKIQPMLSKIKGRLSVDDVVSPLNALKEEAASVPGRESEVAIYDRLINTVTGSFKKGLSASEANELKRKLYQDIGKAFEKPEAERAVIARAQTELARGIRTALERLDPRLAKINAEQGLHLEVRSKIIDAIAKGEIKTVQDAGRFLGSFFKLGDLARTGAGALVGGVPGAIGAEVAGKVIGSAPVTTARAKTATAIGTKKLPPELAQLLQRLGIMNTR